MKRLVLFFRWVAVLSLPMMAAAGELPPDSIYWLRMPLVAQAGQAETLDGFRGQPVLVSMFYASCPNACPSLIAAMRRLENQLDASQRSQLRVLLISMDPDNDTPEKLAEVAARHRVDLDRWRFTRPATTDVRSIAAVLGIQYRALGNGDFNHSSQVTLLDRDGRIVGSTRQPLKPDDGFLAELRAQTLVR